MKTLNIAYRNIFRNGRRSLMTMLAISVSAIAMLLFGGFAFSIMYGLQTGIVQNTGHLHIYQKGFFAFGTGDPTSYSISRYADIIKLITTDSQLKPLTEVVTPILTLGGIAGNFVEDASTTFFGLGVIPSDRHKMEKWNAYRLKMPNFAKTALSDSDTEGGVVGVGLARILHLCNELHISHCSEEKPISTKKSSAVTEDFSALVDLDKLPTETIDKRPKLDLLAATAAGAPNIVSLYVNKAENQGVKEVDDRFIGMHLELAQKLLYGRGEKKVTGIVIQLGQTHHVPVVKERLTQLFADQQLNLEVKDFKELEPMYGQVIGLFAMIFMFVALVMGVIVLFTIINTMMMSVMERVNEIGTIRALGVRRSGILWQFLLEGGLLGIIGATIGTLMGLGLAGIVNMSGLTWTPPNYVEPTFLTIELFNDYLFVPLCWLGLVVIAITSSFFPALKAGQMMIVDALRHI